MNLMASVTAQADQDRKAPGRPRSARADEAIIDAVLDLVAEGNTFDAVSIEAVATRAGVGKATIYRRWPNKEALIVDAVSSIKGPIPGVRGESVREDLVTLLSQVGRKRENRRAGRVMSCLLPELQRSTTLQNCYQAVMEPRREATREVLRRGVRTGELRPDLDIELAVTVLTGPILAQVMLGWNPHLKLDGLAARVVDTVLVGIAGAGAGPGGTAGAGAGPGGTAGAGAGPGGRAGAGAGPGGTAGPVA
jgi:AcrR family transcriptional regulator